jgi:hypothetical protein
MAVDIMEKSLVNCKFLKKSNKLPRNVRMNCKTRIYTRSKEICPPFGICGVCEHSYDRIVFRLAVSRSLQSKFI